MLPVKPRWRPGHAVKFKGEVCEIVAGPYSEGRKWCYHLSQCARSASGELVMANKGRLIDSAELEPHDRFASFSDDDWLAWLTSFVRDGQYSMAEVHDALMLECFANGVPNEVADEYGKVNVLKALQRLRRPHDFEATAPDEPNTAAEPSPDSPEVADYLVQPTVAYAAFIRLNKLIDGKPAYLMRLEHGPKRSDAELLDLETLHPFGFMIMSEAQMTEFAESALAVLTAEVAEA